jgi:predicted transposase YdaD
MQGSVIYQDIKAEGINEGLQEGLNRGVKREKQLGCRMLNHRVGELPEEVRVQVDALSPEQTKALGEALLDFERSTDLTDWLAVHSSTL